MVRKPLQILPFSNQEVEGFDLGALRLVEFCVASVQIVSVEFFSHFVVLTIAKVSWLTLKCMSQCCVS